MLKRFRSKPPQSSRLLRDITTFSAATGSVHRRSHLQLSSYPPLRISYGKTNPELQLLSHCNRLTVVHPLKDHVSSPQNHNHFDSGITSILLIQDHAVSGSDVCKCITPDVLDLEVGRTAVMIEMKIMFKSYGSSHPTSAYCYIYVSFGVVLGWASPFYVLCVPSF
ncbi:hypothetical protein Bca101_091878 [Brassica carinata]